MADTPPADEAAAQHDDGGGSDSDQASVKRTKLAAPTPQEIDACVQVLKAVADNMDIYKTQPLRPLRTALQPFIAEFQSRAFEGQGMHTFKDSKQKKMDAHARKQKQAALDRQVINSRQLRASRINALKALQSDNAHLAISIPDGAACTDAVAPMAIEDTSSATAAGDGTSSPAAGTPTAEEAAQELKQAVLSCYICKARYLELHHFYDSLCPACASLNFQKRTQTANMQGRVAIVTGGRVKIGYHISLKLLRAGCSVLVTTRFPNNAADRFSKEADFAQWSPRLRFWGLDLRNLASIEEFCLWFSNNHERLDVIVNNACQTIRRPPAYYKHLIRAELHPAIAHPNVLSQVPALAEAVSDAAPSASASATSMTPAASAAERPGDSALLAAPGASALMTQVPLVIGDETHDESLFPEGATDVNGQQLDLRTKNSWLLHLDEVSTPEAAEVMAINTLAPFILNSRLKTVMMRVPEADKYIINVSAMEGKFYRFKTANHPHTNMAKAALNMMTRTSGADYAKDHIYMNSVDTGWINDEKPLERAFRHATERNFQTPIDEVDAAARVLDPVFVGVSGGERHFGKFFKDYEETEW